MSGGVLIRWLLARLVGPEMVYSHLAVESVNGSLADGLVLVALDEIRGLPEAVRGL